MNNTRLIRIAFISVFGLYLLCIVGVCWSYSYSTNQAYEIGSFWSFFRGEVGDTFNIVNALFSGIGTIFIVWAMLMQKDTLMSQLESVERQREELKLQREELGMQRKELQYTRNEFELKRANDLVWAQIEHVNTYFHNESEEFTHLSRLFKNHLNSYFDNPLINDASKFLEGLPIRKLLKEDSFLINQFFSEKGSVVNCFAFAYKGIERAWNAFNVLELLRSRHLKEFDEGKNEEMKNEIDFQYDVLKHLMFNNMEPMLFSIGEGAGLWETIYFRIKEGLSQEEIEVEEFGHKVLKMIYMLIEIGEMDKSQPILY